ncbi:MAG: hypothetical protein JWO80_2428 [Bryobacterales bacterium]|nr:hypothetical protein [Bryobacterales bacterium]
MPDIEPARVAVIAVHGVGDHQPFETVKFIGDLLGSLRDEPGRTPRYIPFTETTQRISVRPVKLSLGDHSKSIDWKKPAAKTWGPMDTILQKAAAEPAGGPPVEYAAHVDHLFMEGQLAKFTQDKPEDTYEMLRLQGKRVGSTAVSPGAAALPAADVVGRVASEMQAPVDQPKVNEPGSGARNAEQLVHIYEMYWADLSRLGTGFTQIFGELYQVMFHLSSVGVNNVKAAALHFQKGPAGGAWKNFDRAQMFTATVLAWPIPILNLFLAGFVPGILAISLMRTKLSTAREFIAMEGLVAVLLTALAGYVLMRLGKFSFPHFVLPVALLPFVVCGVALWGVQNEFRLNRDAIEVVTAIVVTCFAFAGVALLIGAYEKQRPGSKKAARWIGGILTVCIGIALAAGRLTGLSANYVALGLSFNVIEICFDLIMISWLVFLVGMSWSLVAGWRAVSAANPKRCPEPDASMHFDRARRTRWSARLLLALPSMAFIIVTLAGWTGVIKMVRPFLPGQANIPAPGREASRFPSHPESNASNAPCADPVCAPMRYTPVAQIKGSPREQWAGMWVDEVMNQAGLTVLPVLLAAAFLAILITAWSIVPAVWDEVSPPRGKVGQDLARQSRALGTWLSYGFRYMHLAGAIVYIAMFVFLAIGFLTRDRTGNLTEILGVLVAGAAVGIFGFGGRLSKLALGFRPAVRVMLDVDNWLREHPLESNPTGRICARYVSVLRHILAWRDENGPYDAIVIIAHSQGTVITSDLLRFLWAEKMQAQDAGKEYDAELARLWADVPVYLFTMGCPLRQLYGLRFPYLYGYARGKDTEHEGGHKIPDLEVHLTPDPGELGVQAWYNAFRSGDYIGRNLWRADKCSYVWEPSIQGEQEQWDPPVGKPKHVSMDRTGRRVEFCIGPGAHTHYWDSTARPIGEMLDLLIKDCSKPKGALAAHNTGQRAAGTGI